jgi:hypothetical protein
MAIAVNVVVDEVVVNDVKVLVQEIVQEVHVCTCTCIHAHEARSGIYYQTFSI